SVCASGPILTCHCRRCSSRTRYVMLKPATSLERTSYLASTAGAASSDATPVLRLRGCGPGSIQSSASWPAVSGPFYVDFTDDALIGALSAQRMGHLLDVVPSHMGIAKSSNPWWLGVLENGPSSRYARFFDIVWHPVKAELVDKVLMPILGDQYGAVLERKEL